MADVNRIQGDLQARIMPILWRLGEGTVDDVRDALPARSRGAYTTIQTVLNRLADRGLLERARTGRAIVYRPVLSEAEYVSRSIEDTLEGASTEARQAVLAQMIGTIDKDEMRELRALARRIARKRGGEG